MHLMTHTHTHTHTLWVELAFCINISTKRMSELRGTSLPCHGYRDLFGLQRVFPGRTPEVPEDMPHPKNMAEP